MRQGWNYRLTEWQGAILLAQLPRLDEHWQRRHANATRLAKELREIPGIQPLTGNARVTRHAWHIFIFRHTPAARDRMSRDRFVEALQAEGNPCSPGYIALTQSPALRDGLARLRPYLPNASEPRPCPVAEWLSTQEAVWLS